MKMIKKLWGVFALSLVLAICSLFVPTYTASAANAVDVTQNVSAANWIQQSELRVTYLSLGEGVIPDIGYGVIDNANYTYVQDYVAINGKTLKEINTDATLGASGWTYTVFPSSADAKYKLPVLVYVNTGKLEIKMHSNYVAMLGDYVEITAKAGLSFENGGTTYEVTEDKSFVVYGTKVSETDITEGVSISGWNVIGNAGELTYTMISFPSGVLPEDLAYQAMDTATWAYIQDYIYLNGKSVKEINTQTDVSGYVFSTFPSTAADIYKVPVIIYENGNNLEVKFHNTYLETLGTRIEITLKAGFSIVHSNAKYAVKSDISYVIEGIVEVDITDGVSINYWQTTGDMSELTYTVISFPDGVLPATMDYGVMDKEAWTYLQEYICLNGKSIKEINETTDASGYEFYTFPSTADSKYKLPAIIYENGNSIEVKFHNTYLKTVGNSIEITVKEGFYVISNGCRYVVASDITANLFTITETEITDEVSVSGWTETGDGKELTYARISFPDGVLPETLDYDVNDKSAWMYLQEYIFLNGKSIKEINETTDVSGYEFYTFPSTADSKYKLPVIIFESGGGLEVKFHNAYLATVEGELEITLGAGLSVLNGAVRYIVNKDVCYQLFEGIWADKNSTFTITYYVNNEVYGEVETYPFKSAFALRENAVTPAGYAFSGWEYTATSLIVQDIVIYGYLTPIQYQITYHTNGGVNDSTNPIAYYVTDGEVVLKDATKEGATFKGWYTSEDYTTKVEKLSPDMLGDIQLYALFEGEETDKGCGSTLSMGCGLLTLAGAAMLLKKRRDAEGK